MVERSDSPITLAGLLGPDLQDEAFTDDVSVPPHAPLIFTFDTDMAWATAMVSFADGSEDLLSRQTFSGNFLNRFEIIPNDGPRRPCTRRPGESMDGEPFSGGCGLGFTPGQTVTLQMFDRSAPIRGFPFPPSSVSLDGQALSAPYLNDEITMGDIRIDVIADATHFNPAEFAVMTGPWFLGVIDSVPGAVNTLVLATQSVNAAGHPAVPDTEPFEFLQSALPAGETVFGLDPPSVRSGTGLLHVYDLDRSEHFDYAFYSWQPPVRILTPADGNDQQLRDEVVVEIVVPSQPVDVTYRLEPLVTGSQITNVTVFANQTSALAVVDLPFQWSTFTLTDGGGTPLDARTVRISEEVMGLTVTAWRLVAGTAGVTPAVLSDNEMRRMFDDPELLSQSSVDEVWTQANIQMQAVSQIPTLDLNNFPGIDPSLATDLRDLDNNGSMCDEAVDLFHLAETLAGFNQQALNAFYVAQINGGNAAGVFCANVPMAVWIATPLQFVVAHELGHLFGLPHPEDDPTTPNPNDCRTDLDPSTGGPLICSLRPQRLMFSNGCCWSTTFNRVNCPNLCIAMTCNQCGSFPPWGGTILLPDGQGLDLDGVDERATSFQGAAALGINAN